MSGDNSRVYSECADRDVVPIIPLRKNSGHRESYPAQERRVAQPVPPPLRRRARVRTLEAPLRPRECSASVGSSGCGSTPIS
jgi:hypothetical protein